MSFHSTDTFRPDSLFVRLVLDPMDAALAVIKVHEGKPLDGSEPDHGRICLKGTPDEEFDALMTAVEVVRALHAVAIERTSEICPQRFGPSDRRTIERKLEAARLTLAWYTAEQLTQEAPGYERGETYTSVAVGTPATMTLGSDAYPYTVVEFSASKKTLVLRADQYRAKRDGSHDYYSNQSYDYRTNEQGQTIKATLRSDGRYRVSGGQQGITLGYRVHRSDPSF
jgi:hypothetical protein